MRNFYATADHARFTPFASHRRGSCSAALIICPAITDLDRQLCLPRPSFKESRSLLSDQNLSEPSKLITACACASNPDADTHLASVFFVHGLRGYPIKSWSRKAPHRRKRSP